MRNLINLNLKLLNFSFKFLLLVISNIAMVMDSAESGPASLKHDSRSKFVATRTATRAGDDLEAYKFAEDRAFLHELSDDPSMLREVRLRAEKFDSELSRRTLAGIATLHKSYDYAVEVCNTETLARIAKINQNLLAEITYRISIEKQLAAVTAALFTTKKRLSETEVALAELRGRSSIPTSTASLGVAGRPPVTPKLRAGSR